MKYYNKSKKIYVHAPYCHRIFRYFFLIDYESDQKIVCAKPSCSRAAISSSSAINLAKICCFSAVYYFLYDIVVSYFTITFGQFLYRSLFLLVQRQESMERTLHLISVHVIDDLINNDRYSSHHPHNGRNPVKTFFYTLHEMCT